jgi:hypothetical protein
VSLNWVKPRWGIGSVRLHLDLADLTLAVLLFDRIVMPTPENDAEFDRWTRHRWHPEQLAARVVQLGDLVDLVPWDEVLRHEWHERQEMLQKLGRETEDLAYLSTPEVIGMRAWDEICGRALREGREPEAPIPVAWYPAAADAVKELRLNTVASMAAPLAELQQSVGLLFRRELAQPMADDPEEALDVALNLATTRQFQIARRTLFECELVIAAQGEPVPEVIERLRTAAREYDALVKDGARRTIRRAVHVVVPVAASHGVALTGIPAAGFIAGRSAKRVLGRFVPLSPEPDPAQNPGAALSMARRAMSAVFSS